MLCEEETKKMRRHGCYHWFGLGTFGFGSPHFGFHFRGPYWRPPRREDYLRWLEEYKEELETGLAEVERKIEELKRETETRRSSLFPGPASGIKSVETTCI